MADGVYLDGGEAECTAREEWVGLPGSCCSAMNGTVLLLRGKECCSGCWVRKSRVDGIDSVCASLETESEGCASELGLWLEVCGVGPTGAGQHKRRETRNNR